MKQTLDDVGLRGMEMMPQGLFVVFADESWLLYTPESLRIALYLHHLGDDRCFVDEERPSAVPALQAPPAPCLPSTGFHFLYD